MGPASALWPGVASPVTPTAVVLSKTLTARPLPMSSAQSSPDLVSGFWTGRLGDAGELSTTFPNATASDGPPWRQRFAPDGHLQWLEIYANENLESVCCIDTVRVDQQQVVVHGQDGWFLLKKAYERDWVVVQAPRDVIERGTQVWVPLITDNFPYVGSSSPASQWTVTTTGGSVAMGQSGGVILSVPAASGDTASIASQSFAAPYPTWQLRATVQYASLPSLNHVRVITNESSGDQLEMQLFAGQALFLSNGSTMAQARLPTAASYSLALESDGEWVWAFVNGTLIGCARRQHTTTTTLQTSVFLSNGGGAAAAATATVTGVQLAALQPFLQRGSDKGDYVLPGSASTYPAGGLHARYYSDTDLQSDPLRLYKILAPNRSQAYAGSGTSEYANQQDAQINGQANPTPGAATSNWSAKWFGAIYLKLSAGNYTFSVVTPAVNTAVRVWIGKTKFGDQLVDQWTFANHGTLSFTVTASALAGTLGYGAGTQQRDGWYPIKIEYAVDATAGVAPTLNLTNSPGAYTDPGGTAIASGAQTTIVPATSLSPLGCVDQRYQGVSHFDLVQQTITGFGYQASVEPQQLESGLFPGVLAPRIREGHDTDIILQPDTGPPQDGEGLLNYSSTLDATDFASSLQGNGAGFQNGTSGQLQADVYDPPTLLASLFDAQGWQDFSDASFVELLQALLNSRLGLQLAPWQLLSADPNGANRLAYTWPLPGSLAKMLWRPGDGLRIQARDINVYDTTPRQLLVITRNIAPNGVTSTTGSFANRPRNQAHMLKRLLYAATRPQRNYQKQLVALTGAFVTGSIAPLGTGGNSTVLTLATDVIVRAYLRVSVNSSPQSFDVLVNGVDQTASLGATAGTGWTTVPVSLPLGPVAVPDANGQLYAALKNNSGATASTYSYQLFVDVLR